MWDTQPEIDTKMSQLFDVIFAYSPKNDDELELKVGDKIEFFESVEEGKFDEEILDYDCSAF